MEKQFLIFEPDAVEKKEIESLIPAIELMKLSFGIDTSLQDTYVIGCSNE